MLGCDRIILRGKNMKAELKFDLNDQDDKIYFLLAQRGSQFYSMLHDVESFLRTKSKYGDYEHEETQEVVDAIYAEVLELIRGYNEEIP